MLSEWKNGVIIKNLKKCHVYDCGNWRGISVYPVACKHFCKALLKRMELEVDGVL